MAVVPTIIYNNTEYKGFIAFIKSLKTERTYNQITSFIYNNIKNDRKEKLYNLDENKLVKLKFNDYIKGIVHHENRACLFQYNWKIYIGIKHIKKAFNLPRHCIENLLKEFNLKGKRGKLINIDKHKEFKAKLEKAIDLRKQGIMDVKKIKFIYKDIIFNSIAELSDSIKQHRSYLRQYEIFKNTIKGKKIINLEEEPKLLTFLKIKGLNSFIKKHEEEKQKQQFDDAVLNFCKDNDIPYSKVCLYIKNYNIKTIEQLRKAYKNVI